MSIVAFPRVPEDLPNGLLLGWQAGKDGSMVPLWDTGREGHLMTIAPTGAGKGVSCIIPALLTWQGPAVVIDPRGENYAVTGAYRASLGQAVHVLDPFGVTAAPNKGRLNPLDLISPVSTTIEDDAASIASCLTAGRTFKDDPFWDERAEALMAGLIAAQFSDTHDLFREPTLGVVRDQVAAGHDQPRTLADVLEEGSKPAQPKILPSQFGSDRTRSSILSTASSHLGFLRNGPVRECLSRSTFAVSDITDGAPITIYLVLPPDKLRSHGSLLRLWLGTVLMAIARRQQVPALPTLMLVDEAAQLGELEHLRSAITLMRGYGMRVWTFWQDVSQLKRVYPRDWESIVNNSTTLQLFGTVTRRTLDTLEIDGSAPPNQANQQLLVRRPDGTATLIRPNYRTDRAFLGMSAPNPFHGQPAAAEFIPFLRDLPAPKSLGRE